MQNSAASGTVILMSLDASLQDPLRFNRKAPPCAVVIYGANGDLTKRKLVPALYRLAYEGRLAPGFAIVGVSRTPMSNDEFREKMHESVKKFLEDSPFDEDLWRSFAQGLSYASTSKALPKSARPKATSSSTFRRSPASTPRPLKAWPPLV
jgi:glucose-6-phosphate 1-dehydrogenase